LFWGIRFDTVARIGDWQNPYRNGRGCVKIFDTEGSSMLGKKTFTFLALGLSLAACGPSLDKVVDAQCPPVNILTTADIWQQGGIRAQLSLVELACFIDSKTDELQASVRVRGTLNQTGTDLALFAAALNTQNEIVARTQVKASPSESAYSLMIPKFVYGQKGGESAKARVVVGFVLTPEQLQANRATYKRQLGLRE
jgi:hypothetical protein